MPRLLQLGCHQTRAGWQEMPCAVLATNQPSETGPRSGVAVGGSSKAGITPATVFSGVIDIQGKDRTQSRLRQARHGHPSVAEPGARVFRPTRLLKPAGTRPEPACQVPSAEGPPVASHGNRIERELEPPENVIPGLKLLGGTAA